MMLIESLRRIKERAEENKQKTEKIRLNTEDLIPSGSYIALAEDLKMEENKSTSQGLADVIVIEFTILNENPEINERKIYYKIFVNKGIISKKTKTQIKNIVGYFTSEIDPNDVIGKFYEIEVYHNKKDGEVYANVSNATPLSEDEVFDYVNEISKVS